MITTIYARTYLPLLGCCLTIAGCDSEAAPPASSPETVHGMTRDRIHYTFLKWDEGLAVMLVDRMDAGSTSGSSSAGGPDRRTGSRSWWNADASEWRHGYDWQLATHDGRTAIFTINDVEYDLENGAVFRVDASGDTTTVRQLDRDLTGLGADGQACDRFVTLNPELTAGESAGEP